MTKASDHTFHKALTMSVKLKEKHGWKLEIGAGFIAEDIQEMTHIPPSKSIDFTFSWGKQTIEIKELNLRETEEALRYLDIKRAQWNEEFNKKLRESL